MAQTKSIVRLPGLAYAISNTGPLISAFQSDSFGLLTKIFPIVYVSTACVGELKKHGWEQEVRDASSEFEVVKLTAVEEKRALTFAMHIARHPDTNDPVVANHIGESQAIALALRSKHRNDLLLLDELAARAIAKQAGVKLSGFPGVLLLATQGGLISPEELKDRLEICREKGTHYSTTFIQQVYEIAKQGRR